MTIAEDPARRAQQIDAGFAAEKRAAEALIREAKNAGWIKTFALAKAAGVTNENNFYLWLAKNHPDVEAAATSGVPLPEDVVQVYVDGRGRQRNLQRDEQRAATRRKARHQEHGRQRAFESNEVGPLEEASRKDDRRCRRALLELYISKLPPISRSVVQTVLDNQSPKQPGGSPGYWALRKRLQRACDAITTITGCSVRHAFM